MVAAMAVLLTGCSPEYVVFNPVGPVAKTELHLIILSTILVAIVVIPVLILLAVIVYRYRDKPGNNAPYSPQWVDSKKLEIVWWGIPIIIIAILGAFTAKTTFSLTKPPENNVKPITIQVVSLNWKWLFEYPDQKIATVNYVNIPTGVPVQFELTSDAPMNSFWIPQLGGQEYTMPGMAMRLWLQADKPGTYSGYGANFSGEGFAHMNFKVNSMSEADFTNWVNQVKSSSPALTMAGYNQLKQDSLAKQQSYSSYPPGLFNDVVMQNGGQYMYKQQMPGASDSTGNSSGSMDMSNMDMGNSDSGQ
ncbi:cytochrome aa3 quinol oxidase subunit II [Alicyclobacillus contaminans]|uniref:cytochrome aa3 quinol oxidase subunit II n=1 Tax=Alicyclobacillus contaminans TaxID=392016 RepID=UPI000685B748|nr:cytochrome aa3 quinol oxidase subunit II [Alicyclobacillus contaminans]